MQKALANRYIQCNPFPSIIPLRGFGLLAILVKWDPYESLGIYLRRLSLGEQMMRNIPIKKLSPINYEDLCTETHVQA